MGQTKERWSIYSNLRYSMSRIPMKSDLQTKKQLVGFLGLNDLATKYGLSNYEPKLYMMSQEWEEN